MLSDIFSPNAKERPAFHFYRFAKVMLGVMPRNALRRLFGVQFHYPVKLYCFASLTDSLCSSAAHPCAVQSHKIAIKLFTGIRKQKNLRVEAKVELRRRIGIDAF
jgi:hypothetical protein